MAHVFAPHRLNRLRRYVEEERKTNRCAEQLGDLLQGSEDAVMHVRIGVDRGAVSNSILRC
jgi:hypothetical protein